MFAVFGDSLSNNETSAFTEFKVLMVAVSESKWNWVRGELMGMTNLSKGLKWYCLNDATY